MEEPKTLTGRLWHEIEPIVVHVGGAAALFVMGTLLVKIRIWTAPEEVAKCRALPSGAAASSVCIQLLVLNSFELFVVIVGTLHAVGLLTIRMINSVSAEWRSSKGARGRSGGRRRKSWRDIAAEQLDTALNGREIGPTMILYVLLTIVLLPIMFGATVLIMAFALIAMLNVDERVIAAAVALLALAIAYATLFWLRHGGRPRRA